MSGFSDRTLAECYKSIPNFQNDTEPTMRGTIFHQADISDISAGARRIDLGKSSVSVTDFTSLKRLSLLGKLIKGQQGTLKAFENSETKIIDWPGSVRNLYGGIQS